MVKTMIALAGACLLAGATAGYAADSDTGKARRQLDCSQAKDPKACEERRDKARAAMKKANAACEAKKGDERRDCMRKEMCAQSKDPGKCEAHVKERMQMRKQAFEACKDKKGEDMKSCVREQRGKK